MLRIRANIINKNSLLIALFFTSTIFFQSVSVSHVDAFSTGSFTISTGYSQSKSPTLSGTLGDTSCTDLLVAIFDDTGTQIIRNSAGTPAINLSNGTWTYDLQSANISLINGYYDVLLESLCENSTYDDPLYADYFEDAVFIVPDICDFNCVPVHRFYNFVKGAHFYTTSEDEKRLVMSYENQYRYEGISSFALETPESYSGTPNPEMGVDATWGTYNSAPVHRFYNYKMGVHFYTANQSEATYLNDSLWSIYRYEGIAYYSYANYPGIYDSTTYNVSSPVSRFYKLNGGLHFYTANTTEANNVRYKLSSAYRYEGIAFYNIENR